MCKEVQPEAYVSARKILGVDKYFVMINDVRGWWLYYGKASVKFQNPLSDGVIIDLSLPIDHYLTERFGNGDTTSYWQPKTRNEHIEEMRKQGFTFGYKRGEGYWVENTRNNRDLIASLITTKFPSAEVAEFRTSELNPKEIIAITAVIKNLEDINSEVPVMGKSYIVPSEVSEELGKEQVSSMVVQIRKWWGLYGYASVHFLTPVSHGVEVQLSFPYYPPQIEEYKGVSINERIQEECTRSSYVEEMKQQGFTFSCTEENGDWVQDTPQNRALITSLLTNRFPSIQVTEFVNIPSQPEALLGVIADIKEIQDILKSMTPD